MQMVDPQSFLKLHVEHERRLYAYIVSILPNLADADDVLQETILILWEKFEQFEPGTDYLAWACQIARYRVLKYYEKKRSSPLRFRPEVVEAVSEEISRVGPLLDARQRALAGCLGKLPSKDLDLLQRRYVQDSPPREVARQVGRSVDAIYKALARIHEVLTDCVQRRLAGE